jgi:hypothetical protein
VQTFKISNFTNTCSFFTDKTMTVSSTADVTMSELSPSKTPASAKAKTAVQWQDLRAARIGFGEAQRWVHVELLS